MEYVTLIVSDKYCKNSFYCVINDVCNDEKNVRSAVESVLSRFYSDKFEWHGNLVVFHTTTGILMMANVFKIDQELVYDTISGPNGSKVIFEGHSF